MKVVGHFFETWLNASVDFDVKYLCSVEANEECSTLAMANSSSPPPLQHCVDDTRIYGDTTSKVAGDSTREEIHNLEGSTNRAKIFASPTYAGCPNDIVKKNRFASLTHKTLVRGYARDLGSMDEAFFDFLPELSVVLAVKYATQMPSFRRLLKWIRLSVVTMSPLWRILKKLFMYHARQVGDG